jgi:phage portal protein BeeE
VNRIEARRRRNNERYLLPGDAFAWNGLSYTIGSTGSRQEEIAPHIGPYVQALLASPPAFAAQTVRAQLLEQARFVWRGNRLNSAPGRLFGTNELSVLEQPWPGGNTGELLSRMEWHAGPAGNAYVVRQGNRLRLLRPDWVTIIIGSNTSPDAPGWALDGEVVGYLYRPGGGNGGRNESGAQTLLPEQVAHWAPIPDPMASYRGMSWMTPIIREIQADSAASDHKLQFFRNGATPQMVFSLDPTVTPEQMREFKMATESAINGVGNAYKNLYLGGGADVTVVGKDLQQIDFTSVQAMTENRIAVASRVPAALLGIKEGLQGSTLNAGNFGATRRMMADTWFYPTLQSMCSTLAHLLPSKVDAELWYDNDIPFLREDARDAAEIIATNSQAIRQLVDAGFDPSSAVDAVVSNDLTLLAHNGLFSVQLQPPGTAEPAP